MTQPPDDRNVPKPSMAAQRLRDSIDKGLTGDKVPAADPAAAPLGTDDEAAGVRTAHHEAPGAPVPEEQRAPPGHAKGDDAFLSGDYGTRTKRD